MKRKVNIEERSISLRNTPAVETMGGKGQLFTTYEKSWLCKSCNQENYTVRIRCLRCKKKKPENIGHDYVESPALIAHQLGDISSLHEAVDPSTQKM